jgi:hypothetical protein
MLAQSGMGIVRACNYQFAAGQGVMRLREGVEIFQYFLSREADELDESMLVQVMAPFGELLAHLEDTGEEDALESLTDSLEQITEESPNLRSFVVDGDPSRLDRAVEMAEGKLIPPSQGKSPFFLDRYLSWLSLRRRHPPHARAAPNPVERCASRRSYNLATQYCCSFARPRWQWVLQS